MDDARHALHVNDAALRGWVAQTSPACAAASVAGVVNALAFPLGRDDPGACFQLGLLRACQAQETQQRVTHCTCKRPC